MDEQQFLESVGKRIREARTLLNLSQEQLAERVGKTQNTISAYETGSRAMRIVEIPVFAEALKMSMAQLLGEEKAKDELLQERFSQLMPPFDSWFLDDAERYLKLQEEAEEAQRTGKRIRQPRRGGYSLARQTMARHQNTNRSYEQIAYDLYVDASAVYRNISPEKIRSEKPLDAFLETLEDLAPRYLNDEFSIESFSSILGVDKAPLNDILRHLNYIE